MSQMNRQVGGTHYKDMPIQPWQLMREEMGDTGFAFYLLGAIVKYSMRAGKKPGTDDRAKAVHHTAMLQEVLDDGNVERRFSARMQATLTRLRALGRMADEL